MREGLPAAAAAASCACRLALWLITVHRECCGMTLWHAGPSAIVFFVWVQMFTHAERVQQNAL